MSHNTLINEYWAQCVKCHKIHPAKLFPRSKTHPWMPGLWCKRSQKKIDRPPKAKAKKRKPAKPVAEEQTGISREFLDKLAKTLLPPKRECKPYVILPSATNRSKPRTRTEFDEEFGWFEFYLRDRLVGIGKTEKEAVEDSVRRKGIPYSLVPSFKAELDKRAATPAITTTDASHHQGTSNSGGFSLPTIPADTVAAETNNLQATPQAV